MHHIFIYVNQAINCSLPRNKHKHEIVFSENHSGYRCGKSKHALIYLISKEGRWGRKSFPTKKHMNTQSSTLLSKSKVKGRLAMVSSLSKYCNTQESGHQQTACTEL